MALEGVSKSYGGIDALKDVSLELRSGEICAILGSNGAGKSTLIKCLTGAITPDGGHVVVDGATVTFVHPSQALAAGVRVVYQELSLFPALSVTENLLGPTVLGRWIRWRRAHVTASNDLQGFGVSIDPRGRVEDLSLGEQQIVEIVRAVRSGGRIVILDEPTSSLGPAQSEALFEFLHTLAATGVAVLFVTQHFNDALEHADWISVMREGRLSEPQARMSRA
jgi:ABC-type sugar transport system ATPase subunit